MKIPYVIDNQRHKLADVLNELLKRHDGKSLDVATAYFNIGGFKLLQNGLEKLGNFRLLLGDEPYGGTAIGLNPREPRIIRKLVEDLDYEPFTKDTLRVVEDLIAFLKRKNVAVRVYEKGFLHAKCYLFYNDSPSHGWDRFQPLAAIVGSSNFTGPGLTSNRELNLAHKTVLSDEEVLEDPQKILFPVSELKQGRDLDRLEEKRVLKSSVGAHAIADIDEWFERQWADSRDFKENLIELLNSSKFGQKEYTPYEVYIKAMYEYMSDSLESDQADNTRSAVELSEFQEDAVKKARKILAKYDGVIVADSVGLGKTWIGKKLLEDYAYHMRQKAIVVCPASLREMWTKELHDVTIAAKIISQEELGREDYNYMDYGDADVILIDESHNFRSSVSQRYENLSGLIKYNGGKGRGSNRKKVILLTATPINNGIFDLYSQVTLITHNDRSYFASAGIGDLYRYFLHVRRNLRGDNNGIELFNLLEEVVVRRTRQFIRRAYPNATIKGKTIHWPERKLKTIRYDLENTYEGIYEDIVAGIDGLKLAPYNLESYKKPETQKDEMEVGREQALVGIFKSRYLKRFESSVAAFRISVKRALEFIKTFESYILEGKVLNSADFKKAMRYLAGEGEDDDVMPTSKADLLDESKEARELLEGMEILDTSQYDLRRLHDALQHDVEVLSEMWSKIKDIKPEKDAKLKRLRELLSQELKGKKVLVFTYYKDTARYLYGELGGDSGETFRQSIGNPNIKRMDGSTHPKDREKTVQAFAPKANNRTDYLGTDKEIGILISTDVLSEGQNLQDCGVMINYDLHWNPTRMVQRAGRIDRIGTNYNVLLICNMFPDEGLERLLGLVDRLNRKIWDINESGFLDASILGETVNPQNFNTLRRIRDEDGAVIEEEERFSELVSNEYMLQHLKNFIKSEGIEKLENLPDGIHSGLRREGCKGVFFYFTAEVEGDSGKRHFWRYYDFKQQRILDNRFVITSLISCEADTPRFVDDSIDVFEIQEKVIDNIINTTKEQRAIEEAPRILEPIQQNVITLLQSYMHTPGINREEIRSLRKFLNQPMMPVHLKSLRNSFRDYQNNKDLDLFLTVLKNLREKYGMSEMKSNGGTLSLKKEDLHLICFDIISS